MGKKHKYNKSEFINILCKKCDLCKNTADPAFCYEIIYKNSKRKFIQKVFPKLLILKAKEKVTGIPICTYSPEDFKSMFTQTFCNMGVCGKGIEECDNIPQCTTMFRLQLHGVKSTTKLSFNNRKVKKKKKNKYIVKPYPTFFTNDREDWKKEIHESLLIKGEEYGYE